MIEIEYTTVDKTGWDDGPWQSEPDKMQWQDPGTGMPCLIVRNRGGALCGYVGVNPDHPWHGLSYGENVGCNSDCDEWCYEHSIGSRVSAHGGLTFSDRCGHGPEAEGICHVPAVGERDDVWWFGFDCAHYRDIRPAATFLERVHGWSSLDDSDAVYRDVAYVKAEIANLAEQLAAVT